MKKKKLLAKAISSPNNLHFVELVTLVQGFGFKLSRTEGSHHIFVLPGTSLRLNFQNIGSKAKPYQVRQFLKMVEENNLQLETGE